MSEGIAGDFLNLLVWIFIGKHLKINIIHTHTAACLWVDSIERQLEVQEEIWLSSQRKQRGCREGCWAINPVLQSDIRKRCEIHQKQNPLHLVLNIYDLACHTADRGIKESGARQTKLIIPYLLEQACLLLLQLPYIRVRSKIKWSKKEKKNKICNKLIPSEFSQAVGDDQDLYE